MKNLVIEYNSTDKTGRVIWNSIVYSFKKEGNMYVIPEFKPFKSFDNMKSFFNKLS